MFTHQPSKISISWVICSSIFNMPQWRMGKLIFYSHWLRTTRGRTGKHLPGYHHSELLGEFLLFLVLELFNYINRHFFSRQTYSYVNISREFFQHFQWRITSGIQKHFFRFLMKELSSRQKLVVFIKKGLTVLQVLAAAEGSFPSCCHTKNTDKLHTTLISLQCYEPRIYQTLVWKKVLNYSRWCFCITAFNIWTFRAESGKHL